MTKINAACSSKPVTYINTMPLDKTHSQGYFFGRVIPAAADVAPGREPQAEISERWSTEVQ